MKIFLWVMMVWVFAVNADEAQQKAASCTACHGANGISPNHLWPNIAGQKEDYLAAQLKAFRDGTRVNPLMSPVSKTLSESDIKLFAAYFANLKGGQ